MLRFLLVAALLLVHAHRAQALEHVKFTQGDQEISISGELQLTAQDGGLLMLDRDGRLWTIEPNQLIERKSDDEAFQPSTQQEAAKQLLAELPSGFDVHTTAHYVIAHNTSRAYAQWVGALYERLYAAFTNYWKQRGFKLHEPKLPLVAIVFASKNSYIPQVQDELGDAAGLIVGYYSLKSNRINMYDLTGLESIRQADDRRGSAAQISRMLARPEAEPMVATIIHEATHQIAFNCGLQTRLSDVPVWLSEGLAIYFESPDLSSSKGWRTIGAVHRTRLAQFRAFLHRRPADSLLSLIMNDDRIRDPRQAGDAYAEAWALNYYLIRQRPKQYVSYLQTMAAKQPLVFDSPDERLKEFKAAFGQDLAALETDFLRYIERVR